jgi:hypothetical protein
VWSQLRFPFAGSPERESPAMRRMPPRRRHLVTSLAEDGQPLIPAERLRLGGGGAAPAPEAKRPRKCSPMSRARTINVGKLPRSVKLGADSYELWERDHLAARPKHRGECESGPRPCPWMSCRFHTALDVDEENGSIKEVFPDFRILEEPDGDGLERLQAHVGTCALDIVADHDDGTGGIGGLVQLYQLASAGKPLGQTNGMTIEETGKAFGLSIERVRQIGSQAMQDVRITLRRWER